MKNVQRTICGKKITIYLVDKDLEDQINRVLETKDDKLIDRYFLLIHKQQLRDRANTRRHQSLEVSIEAGHQFEDEGACLDDILIEREERSNLYEAIKTLNKEQQWLLKQVYVLERTQLEVAKELGVSHVAIIYRLKVIYAKLRNFLGK